MTLSKEQCDRMFGAMQGAYGPAANLRGPKPMINDTHPFTDRPRELDDPLPSPKKVEHNYIPVRVLSAINGSDFSEQDIIIVCLTDEGGAKALRERLQKKWDAMNSDDQQFYDNDFEKYYQHWDINTTGTRLEP